VVAYTCNSIQLSVHLRGKIRAFVPADAAITPFFRPSRSNSFNAFRPPRSLKLAESKLTQNSISKGNYQQTCHVPPSGQQKVLLVHDVHSTLGGHFQAATDGRHFHALSNTVCGSANVTKCDVDGSWVRAGRETCANVSPATRNTSTWSLPSGRRRPHKEYTSQHLETGVQRTSNGWEGREAPGNTTKGGWQHGRNCIP
jgi:hypothetical protein